MPYVTAGDGRCWGWVALRVTAAVDLTKRAEYARLTVPQRLVRAVGEQGEYVTRFLGLPESWVVALRLVRLQRGDVQAFLLGRVHGQTAEQAADAARSLGTTLAGVPDHVRVTPVADPDEVCRVLSPFTPAASGLVQVHKRIRVARPERVDAHVPAYVAVEPFGREPADWTPLWEVLRSHPSPLALSVELVADTVSGQVRRMLEGEATRYRRLAHPLEEEADVGGHLQLPADSGAATIEPYYFDALRRYDARAFRFAVTLASPDPIPDTLATHVAATVSPSTRSHPQRDDPQAVLSGYALARPTSQAEHDEMASAFTTLQPTDWGAADLHRLLATEVPPGYTSGRAALRQLRLLVDRHEATSLFRLPAAIEGHLPGMQVIAPRDQVRNLPSATGPALLLGHQPGAEDSTGAVEFPVADLPRHGFIVGTPGSGKTNTALHLCRQLWTEHRIPFAVIEPVNAELNDYRWLATQPGFDDLLVFTIGDDDTAPLRLNPFQAPGGATINSHVSNLLACFEAAFGLWDPLPFLYRRALVETYRRRGFHGAHRAQPEDLDRWPVLTEFVAALTEVVEQLGYQGEVYANIDAAARLRAEALAEGACGTTLNCRRSYDIATLMHRPVVYELAAVGDNAKEQALVTLLIITAIRGWYRHRRRSTDPPHVLLLEEAHRVFPRHQPNTTSGDMKEGNAQALAAERIAQGLAEDRKYRQSYLLIDQQVGKVAEDAYKITNLKIMHRTSAEEDRRLLGETMAIHVDQLQAAAALKPFEALVSHNALEHAVLAAIPNVRGMDAEAYGLTEAPLASDEALRQRFDDWRSTDATVAEALAPYAECEGCKHRCVFRRQVEAVLGTEAAGDAVIDLFDDNFDSPNPLASEEWYEALPERLEILGGNASALSQNYASESWAEDYAACLFMHALRLRYPSAEWTERDRSEALIWMRNARTAIRGFYE
ncbi:ATP-binding protein [Actinoplanes xinjiangensis]|uniref:ATP-binding protein n=1 Tax=Actinoplanes xinjiangensis TaxID=512350 RepID=UPI00342C8A82